MPATTLNWKKPTSRPRQAAGAISAIYKGPSTLDPPMPKPPMNRKNNSEGKSHEMAEPRADTIYNTAMIRKLSRRPYLSPGTPPKIAPMMVPHRALETVTPSMASERWKISFSAEVAPAITAVSKPKSRPPRAATIVLLMR